jgi:hypothetical protein
MFFWGEYLFLNAFFENIPSDLKSAETFGFFKPTLTCLKMLPFLIQQYETAVQRQKN